MSKQGINVSGSGYASGGNNTFTNTTCTKTTSGGWNVITPSANAGLADGTTVVVRGSTPRDPKRLFAPGAEITMKLPSGNCVFVCESIVDGISHVRQVGREKYGAKWETTDQAYDWDPEDCAAVRTEKDVWRVKEDPELRECVCERGPIETLDGYACASCLAEDR